MSKLGKYFGRRLMRKCLALMLAGAVAVSGMPSYAAEDVAAAQYEEEESTLSEAASASLEESAEENEAAQTKKETPETPSQDASSEPQKESAAKSDAAAEDGETAETSSDEASSDVQETTEEEQGAGEKDNKAEPTAGSDGYYNGFEVSTPDIKGYYYFDFGKTFNAQTTISNSLQQGLFSYSKSQGSNEATYHSTKYGFEVHDGNILTFKVAGNCDIVVGGDNNNDLNAKLSASASASDGTFQPSEYDKIQTSNSTNQGHAELVDCKNRNSVNTFVYKYTGGAGNVSLTLAGTKAYIAYICITPRQEKVKDIYVGYSDKTLNFKTVTEAVKKAAPISPQSESDRITIHIKPGEYREQIIVDKPYISFVNDEPEKGKVLLTWYYGIGYKYYSVDAETGLYNPDNAKAKSNQYNAKKWGAAVYVKPGATAFRAEGITFENSFNRYMTTEEREDGVTLSTAGTGSDININRTVGTDVNTKAATERAAALVVEADKAEFRNCEFYSSQDTLYIGAGESPNYVRTYFKDCVIEGETDYIFGYGDNIFDGCELRWKGYSEGADGGYITATRFKHTESGKTSNERKGYLFRNCKITANKKSVQGADLNVAPGYFGRPWGAESTVVFMNTELENANMIVANGWNEMSGRTPEKAHFSEYNTVIKGGASADTTPAVTSSRIAGTVLTTKPDDTLKSYYGDWTPSFYVDPAEASTLAKYNMEGFAKAAAVTGGGVITPGGTNYYTAATEKEFLDALSKVKSKKTTPSVIEITADMNLGDIELAEKSITIGSKSSYTFIEKDKMAPLTHPTLLKTGVTLMTLQDLSNLTIFSKNGSSIKHCGLVLKSVKNVIIRNITFDELWEWDEGATEGGKTYKPGDYDRNDWDYIGIQDSDGIWIDHCTFYKAYDGIVDIKFSAIKETGKEDDITYHPDIHKSNVTISWCRFLPASALVNGEPKFFNDMMNWLEENQDKAPYYKSMRDANATVEHIRRYAYGHKKTHLLGQDDKASNATGIKLTLANNYYKDSMDRMPRLRFGTVHEYNCVLDGQDLYTWRNDTTNPERGKITSNGAISTCGGKMLLENCYINGIENPLNSGNGSSPTGYINAVDSLYFKNGTAATLEPKKNGSGTGTLLVTNAAEFISALPYKDYIKYPASSLNTDAADSIKTLAGAGVLNLSEAQWEKTTYGAGDGGGTVNPNPPAETTKHTVTVNGGTSKSGSDTSGSYAPEATVTITAGTAPSGQVFDKWTTTGITLTEEQKTQNPLVFSMPKNDVTVTANMKATVSLSADDIEWIEAELKTDSKNNKYRELSQDYTKNGFTIKATASSTVSVDKNGKTLDNKTFSQRIKLTGQGSEESRSIHFKAKKAGTLTVFEMSASGTEARKCQLFKSGSKTPLLEENAPIDSLKKATFNITESGDYYIAGSGGINIYYISFEYPVTKYNVTVNSGTGGGDYEQGDIVTITAAQPQTGKKFKDWTVVSGGVTLADATANTTTFTMPANAVTVKANYENDTPTPEPTTYTVTVTGGTITGGTATTGSYKEGDNVSITANDAPSGKHFKEWTATGIALTDAQKTQTPLTFTMPAGDVTVTAEYETDTPTEPAKYTVTVTGGTITGGTDTTGSYAEGDNVSITANEPETGKHFKEWTATGADSLTAEQKKANPLTFKMPANDVTAEAVYENIPPAESGTDTSESGTDTFYGEAEGANEELVKYNLEGYASGVTGGGLLKEGSKNYYKVTNEREFIDALNSVRNLGTEGGLKPPAEIKPAVIEITGDLNLGYLELENKGIDIDAKPDKTVIEKQKVQPLIHPTLKSTGVSMIKLNYFHNLTIFSKNGSSIKHAGISFEGDTSNIIIRNITFDELWEWDEKTEGGYDNNSWDYMEMKEQTDRIWIDHCTFYKAYDGIIDIKGDRDKKIDSQRVTISWCEFLPGSKNDTFFNEQMDWLEANKDSTKYYKSLRASQSAENVKWYAYGQKKTQLFGADDADKYAKMIMVTLANNYYKNSMDRMPRLRFGKVHEYNCILDAQELLDKKNAGVSGITSNGAISTCNGEMLLENCYISGITNPLNSGNGSSPTGYINAVDSLYFMGGTETKLEPNKNGSGTGELLVTDAEKFRSGLPYSSYTKYNASELKDKVQPNSGAGKLTMTTVQWERANYSSTNPDPTPDDPALVETPKAPTANPAQGGVEKGTSVILTCATAGAKIYYTTDGKVPTASSTPYAAPIKINEAVTIKAVAVNGEGANAKTSDVAEFKYTLIDHYIYIKFKDGKTTEDGKTTYDYTGAKVIPVFEVWDFNQSGGTLLAEGIDYTVSYKNNQKVTETDAAKILVKGKGNYKGQDVEAEFWIAEAEYKGELDNIKGAKLTFDESVPVTYNGDSQFPAFTLTLNDTKTKYAEYTDPASGVKSYKRADEAGNGNLNVKISVSNNVSKGTATILVTGANDEKNGKPTSLKKTFKINPADISSAEIEPAQGTLLTAEYAVKGAVLKPGSFKVMYGTTELKLGKDYAVKYSGNKKAGQSGTITVTGRGNYAKKTTASYEITQADMQKLNVDAVAAYAGIKAGKIKAVVTDANGDALKASQYKLTICKAAVNPDGNKTPGEEYADADVLEADTWICVKAEAADSVNLTAAATNPAYFQIGTDISKAKITVKPKEYTGGEIKLTQEDIEKAEIKVSGMTEQLSISTDDGKTGDFIIVSYSNNINKGTAAAVIQGINGYSGTKTIKFKINQKTMQEGTGNIANKFKSFVNNLSN